MQSSPEISIDLTAQELLEVDDIGEIDPMLRTGSFAAKAPPLPDQAEAADSIEIEIELTAEQIEALLSDSGPG